MKLITSAQNPEYKHFLSLTKVRGIKKQQQFLISGEKLVIEALKRTSLKKIALLCPENSTPSVNTDIQVNVFSAGLFRTLDLFGTNSPILVAETPQLPVFTESHSPLEVYLALSDPGNLGASIRSAMGFGASKIVLLNECCHPFHPKVIRTSAGTCMFAPLELGPSINDLAGHFVSLDMKGENISNFNWPESTKLIVGEEGLGVPEHLKTTSVSIPIASSVESLNAMASLSIALFAHKSSRQ